MGRVWVAEHLTLDTNVVVKFMAKEIADTADGAARFAREASVAAAVKSPHVVQMFDHGVTPDGDAYIVMEMLEGRDLSAHLAAHGPMSPSDVAALVAQVAKALGKAHQVGVIHRDIKPDNIFLCNADADGGELFVKLLDFGIAKRDKYLIAGSATTTGAVVGTPYYMSPEQIVGDKEIDARTDIWSLGVVAFEAMTRKRPFEGTTVGAITLAIHTGTRRITDHLPNAPVALDEWFAKACARDPKERFQTPREASQALLAAVGNVPHSAGLLRAPLASIVGVGDESDSKLGSTSDAPSNARAATNLSSVFPVPRPSGPRPALLIAAAAAIVVVTALFAVPALLRPSDPAPKGMGTSAPPASGSGAPTTLASAGPAASASAPVDPPAAAVSAAPSESATRISGVVPSRPAAATTTSKPIPRPTTTPTGKPTKPGRTRDDDDIK